MLKKVAIWTLALVLLGCSSGEDATDDSAILTVNGHVLTQRSVERRGEMAVALRRHRAPTTSEKRLASLYRAYTNGYPRVFIRQTVLSDYAKEHGIEIPEALLYRYRKMAFRAQKSETDKNFDDLLRISGVDAKLFDEQIRAEALQPAVIEYLKKTFPTNFGSDYVAREVAVMRAYNKRMAATNTLVFAHATNVWTQLKNGGNFEALAEKYTETESDRGGNCEWGTFRLDDLRSNFPSISPYAEKMGVGEITPPFEADNGLVILKLTDREEDGSVTLSRIFFRLPLMIEIASDAEIVETAREDHYKDLFEVTLSNLVQKAKIEFKNKTKGTP